MTPSRQIMLMSFLTIFCFGDVVDEILEETEMSQEEIAASGQSPDNYDKPYSLNPVPINPNAPQPATWRDAYGRLCRSIDSMQAQINTLQKKVADLEAEKPLTTPDNEQEDLSSH